MKMRHLEAFLAVAEELHFTRAARRLCIAQPAVSAAIKELEAELGFLLFSRTRRSVALTAAGVRFRKEAEATLQGLDRAVHAARRVAQGKTGRVVVDFTPLAALTVLPLALVQFRRAFPDVEVVLSQRGTARQVERLQAGTSDLGFTVLPGQPGLLSHEPITREPLVAILPTTHPHAGAPSVPIEAVVGLPMLILPRHAEPAMHDAWLRLCAGVGVSPRLELELDQIESVLAFVAAGHGVSLAPASVGRLRLEGVTTTPLSPPVPAGVTMVWSPDVENPAAAALRAQVRAVRDASGGTAELGTSAAGIDGPQGPRTK
jgi:DNA-binding transcriptional LysR family regulator